MDKLYFTGHETFHCRNYWLKKGLDFVDKKYDFNSDEAVVRLGVGKNMVSSIRFWLQAFDLVSENQRIRGLGHWIFDDTEGHDPYLEDIGTIWLLHYNLVTHKRSSIYHLVFNEFRKQRIEFQRRHLQTFITRFCKTRDIYYHPASVKKDIGVFLSNYLLPSKSKKGIEDDFSGLLYELNLVQELDKPGKEKWYKIENSDRPNLPHEIVFFCILSYLVQNKSVSFNELLNDVDSVGSVFALTSQGLMQKIESIIADHPEKIVFTDDGGVRVLQLKESFDRWEVLRAYYEK